MLAVSSLPAESFLFLFFGRPCWLLLSSSGHATEGDTMSLVVCHCGDEVFMQTVIWCVVVVVVGWCLLRPSVLICWNI